MFGCVNAEWLGWDVLFVLEIGFSLLDGGSSYRIEGSREKTTPEWEDKE